MVNVRAKGARGENLVKDLLISHTGLPFTRVPGSGCGKIKGDLHLPDKNNRFCIEVKSYAESHFNDKIFTSKTNNFVCWWNKLTEQAKACGQEPLLFFKYNRSKIFAVTSIKPENTEMFLYICWLSCYIIIAEEWLRKENIKWLK
jgi:Holliday junction resolvase